MARLHLAARRSTSGIRTWTSELPGETLEYGGDRLGSRVAVAGAGPQVYAFRVARGGGRLAQGTGQVVDGRVAQRCGGLVPVDELVAQAAGRSAGERLGDDGLAVTLEGRFVGGRGTALVGEQQRGADDGRHRARIHRGSDVCGCRETTGGEQRQVSRLTNLMEQLDQRDRRRNVPRGKGSGVAAGS